MGTLGGTHTVEIDAPLERCFEIAADIEGAPRWQGTMREVEVHERDGEGRATVVTTIADAKVKEIRTRLRFSYDPPDGMRWEQEKGDPKWLVGNWEFIELDPGRTRAVYSLRADPGRILGMLLRGPVVDQVRSFLLGGAAEGLKRQAESQR